MIEKVAEAINRAGHAGMGNVKITPFKELSEPSKLMVFMLAKAAIEAMKEPTEGMIACAESQFPLFADEYRRAINAALNGK